MVRCGMRAARRAAAWGATLLCGLAPLAAAGEVVALRQARVVTPDGTQENVTLLMADGRVTALGAEVTLPAGCRTLDVAGLTVLPGLIDGFADLPIDREAGTPLLPRSEGAGQDYGKAAFAETAEANRRGLRPELRARALLATPGDEPLGRLRQAGFTAQLLAPLDGFAPGQACLLELSGQPPRRSVVTEPGWLLLKFRSGGGGGPPGAPGGPRQRVREESDSGYPTTLMGALAHLRQAFLDAGHLGRWRAAHRRAPDQIARPPDDECLETLERALAGELRVAFLVDRENDIRRALRLAAEFSLKPVIIGGREGFKCAAELKAAGAPVVASLAFADAPERRGAKLKQPEPQKPREGEPPPASPPAPDASDPANWEVADPVLAEPLELFLERTAEWKQEVGNVAALLAVGVEVALTQRGSSGPPDFFADLRVAIEHGLTNEQALAALTATPARLFGVERELGAVRIGAPASLAVVTGDFASKEREVRHLFIGASHFEFPAKKPVDDESGGGRGGRGRRAREAGTAESGTGAVDPAPAALDLTGSWELVGSGAGGFKSTLTLRQEGGALGGKLESEMGAAEVTKGTLDGDKFRLTVTASFQGRTFEFTLEGTATATALSGTFATPFGEPTAFTATRKPEAAAPVESPYDSHEKGCGCGAHPEDGR